MTLTIKTLEIILAAIFLFAGGVLFGSLLIVKLNNSKTPEITILSVPKGQIAIDPKQTNCKRAKQGFELNHWFTVTEFQENLYAERVGKGELEVKQEETVHCKFVELGEIKQDFYVSENWYRKVKR